MTDNTLATAQQGKMTTINDKARELTTRIRFMIQNGRKLADEEVFALAQYCAANDLNPFAGEAYYLPGIGPCPGIAGWRSKAQQALIWEAETKHLNEPQTFWTEVRAATIDEARFNPSTDIAMHVTLRDSITNKIWRRAYFETLREMKACGLTNTTREDVIAFVGPEPVWCGVGVVFGEEKFGGLDKMDRHERAEKRAEKIALRKRFPRVNLPEPEGADVDYVDAQFEERATPARTETEIMGELGYETEPAKASTPVENKPDDTPSYIDALEKVWPEGGKVSWDMAVSVVNSDGVAYVALDRKDLGGRKIGLDRKLAKNGMTAEERADCELKRDVVDTLLALGMVK